MPLEVTFGLQDVDTKGASKSYPHTVFGVEAKMEKCSLDCCLWPSNLECIKQMLAEPRAGSNGSLLLDCVLSH